MTAKQLGAIESFAKKIYAKTLDPQHDYGHVIRVARSAEKIVQIIKVEDEIDGKLLRAACLLHDVVYTAHKPSLITWLKETRYLKKMLPGILKQFQLTESDRYILSEAVYRHTWSFPFRFLNRKYSLYAQIVQDADMLDYLSEIRLLGLEMAKRKFFFYRILSLLSGTAKKKLKKNMLSYLNLPQVYEYLKEG